MKHGTIKKAASKFGLHRNTISLIWNRIPKKKTEKEELILICHQGKKLLMVQNQKIGVLFWKKWKKFLLTKDLLLDHYLLQQTFQ